MELALLLLAAALLSGGSAQNQDDGSGRETRRMKRKDVAVESGKSWIEDVGKGKQGSPFAEMSAHELFRRVFAGCDKESPYILVDVRDNRLFSRGHIPGSYNLRYSKAQRALIDDGHMQHEYGWHEEAHANKHVVIIGDPIFTSRHTWFDNLVFRYFYNEGSCKSLQALKGGFASFADPYSFLLTRSRVEMKRNFYPTPMSISVGEDEFGVAFLGRSRKKTFIDYSSDGHFIFLGTFRQAHFEEIYKDLGITHLIAVGPRRANVPSEVAKIHRVSSSEKNEA
eukprot:jgi/Bigna1/132057/aug1.16_g6765